MLRTQWNRTDIGFAHFWKFFFDRSRWPSENAFNLDMPADNNEIVRCLFTWMVSDTMHPHRRIVDVVDFDSVAADCHRICSLCRRCLSTDLRPNNIFVLVWRPLRPNRATLCDQVWCVRGVRLRCSIHDYWTATLLSHGRQYDCRSRCIVDTSIRRSLRLDWMAVAAVVVVVLFAVCYVMATLNALLSLSACALRWPNEFCRRVFESNCQSTIRLCSFSVALFGFRLFALKSGAIIRTMRRSEFFDTFSCDCCAVSAMAPAKWSGSAMWAYSRWSWITWEYLIKSYFFRTTGTQFSCGAFG